MDKTSVLGDAITYLKHLQERVKTLEEQARMQTMESAVLVKRSQVTAEDESCTDGESGSYDEHPLPEIEARVCNNHILLRVQCEKHKGVLVDLLSKVEKLNLAILHTNVATFGSLALDITIIADVITISILIIEYVKIFQLE
ncbi:UNVERIFIED_CONTAM: Transcription factor bHLH19 [Sesamum indicum]